MGSDDEEAGVGGRGDEGTELARLHHPNKDAWIGNAKSTRVVLGVNDGRQCESGPELAQLNGGRYGIKGNELQGDADGEVVGLIRKGAASSEGE
eukprot:420869-Pelagomonas_calceolata.AAC.1